MLDPSIYNNVGRVNVGARLSDILDQQRQREMQRTQQEQTLASLAQQKELGGFQLRDLQRKEAAIPQQQADADRKKGGELRTHLYGGVQQILMSGTPDAKQRAKAWGVSEAAKYNIPQESTMQALAALDTDQDANAIAQAYDQILNPDVYAKQRAESMFQKEKAAAAAQGQRGQIIFDNQGNAFNVNPYDNTVLPVKIDGKQIQGAQFAPNLQGQISGAREVGKLQGKTQAQARIDLPQDQANATETIKLIDDLLAHKGMKQAVGASSILGLQRVPGTEEKNFAIRLEQLKGKQFLQAFESLKGAGQITEIEGQKATAAISRMDLAATEEEFTQAAREFQNIVRLGLERAKTKAGVADDEWSDL